MAVSSFALVALGGCTAILALALLLFIKSRSDAQYVQSSQSPSFTVVVLGDIGRSPRMQYHSISLASHGATVNVVGFVENTVHPDITSNEAINVVALTPPPPLLGSAYKVLFVLTGPLKVIWQSANLLWITMWVLKPTKWMLVQNPPSIPVLAIVHLVCRVRGTKLVIDWHNLGWSLLALKLGKSHPFVMFSQWYESMFAKSASYHFAVSNAMAVLLRRDFGISALTLHDRPTGHFKPLTADQRSAFLNQLSEELPGISPFVNELRSSSRNMRLIVSSTSWTADEDFSILLDALRAYSKTAANDGGLPKIVVVITGKGPQKPLYMPLITAINKDPQSHVFILTGWLSNTSYASILGSADLGVSLHISTSGVDLPMKAVDMLGSGLPVVGWSGFEAWPELVQDGINGMGFRNSKDLAALMTSLFQQEGQALAILRRGAFKDGKFRWDNEWDSVAGPLFRLVA